MSLTRILFTAVLVLGSCFGFSEKSSESFESTIPVVDLNDFYNPETKQAFVDQVAKALHEVGFFAVINPNIEITTLLGAYKAAQDFFAHSIEDKEQIFNAALNGQRGYVPSEIPQGGKAKDLKEFLHVGKSNNLWPSYMDLQNPLEKLMTSLDEHGNVLQKAFALAMGEPEDYFTEMTGTGECLLRALHYPAGPVPGTVWAGQHTDIDLFTILPMATEEGLQVFHDGKWIEVRVPSDAFIVNCGDKLQNLTNGYFKSSLHRVEAKPDTERYSIVYFIHPRDNDSMSPTASCVELTGGVRRYPEASSLELLSSRLRELGLASPWLLSFEKESGILDRIKELVDAGVAADPVQKTHSIWVKAQPAN